MGPAVKYLAAAAAFSICLSWVPQSAASAVPNLPARTIGSGAAIMSEPTQAPSLELFKARAEYLQRRQNDFSEVPCSQWSILGGYGVPICYYPETCIFYSTVLGNLFQGVEGCGQTSIVYNWVTECFDNILSTGEPPTGQIYCPPAAPFCGTYNFVYGGATYSNLGCSTTPYLYTAILVSDFTSANGTSSSASPTVDIVTQPSSVTVTVTPTNPIVAVASSGPGSSPTTAGSATSGASDQNPSKNSHKSDAGAIAGGVVGGVAAVAIVALLAWLLLRRRKNAANKAEAQEIAAGAAASAASEGAFHSVVANGQHAELAGKPTGTAGYVPVSQEIPQHEKPAGGDPQATEYYKPGAPQEHYGYSPQGGHPDAGAPSPPPIYNTPSPAVSGVSPVAAQHSPHTSELSSNPAFHQVPQNSPPVAGQLQAPQVPELGGTNQAAYQVPPNVSELGTASMAASLATQAPARRPVGGRQQFDMSGAPMTDEYRHELE